MTDSVYLWQKNRLAFLKSLTNNKLFLEDIKPVKESSLFQNSSELSQLLDIHFILKIYSAPSGLEKAVRKWMQTGRIYKNLFVPPIKFGVLPDTVDVAIDGISEVEDLYHYWAIGYTGDVTPAELKDFIKKTMSGKRGSFENIDRISFNKVDYLIWTMHLKGMDSSQIQDKLLDNGHEIEASNIRRRLSTIRKIRGSNYINRYKKPDSGSASF